MTQQRVLLPLTSLSRSRVTKKTNCADMAGNQKLGICGEMTAVRKRGDRGPVFVGGAQKSLARGTRQQRDSLLLLYVCSSFEYSDSIRIFRHALLSILPIASHWSNARYMKATSGASCRVLWEGKTYTERTSLLLSI